MRSFVEKHISGDTLDQKVEIPHFLSTDGWTLKYRFTAQFTTPVQAAIELTAAGNADGTHQVQASSAATAAWAAGSYQWSRWVEKAGAAQTLTGLEESGQLDIRPNPRTTAQGDDARSHERRVLEAIEAVIENRASSTQRDIVAYTIGSRSQTFDTKDDKASLLVLHSKYKWLVANEVDRDKIAAGLPNPRNVGIRFGSP